MGLFLTGVVAGMFIGGSTGFILAGLLTSGKIDDIYHHRDDEPWE